MPTITGHGKVHLHNLQFNGFLGFTQSMQGSFSRKNSMVITIIKLHTKEQNSNVTFGSPPPFLKENNCSFLIAL
jgi:hypothetical protein